jgi:hypothetical protein
MLRIPLEILPQRLEGTKKKKESRRKNLIYPWCLCDFVAENQSLRKISYELTVQRQFITFELISPLATFKDESLLGFGEANRWSRSMAQRNSNCHNYSLFQPDQQ